MYVCSIIRDSFDCCKLLNRVEPITQTKPDQTRGKEKKEIKGEKEKRRKRRKGGKGEKGEKEKKKKNGEKRRK